MDGRNDSREDKIRSQKGNWGLTVHSSCKAGFYTRHQPQVFLKEILSFFHQGVTCHHLGTKIVIRNVEVVTLR